MENYRELIEEKLDNVILQHSYSRNREKRVGSEYVEFVDWLVEELGRAREEVEKKFREKRKKREEEMNVPYSEEDGKDFFQGYQEGYHQGLHDMIIDTYYLDEEFQSKLKQ